MRSYGTCQVCGEDILVPDDQGADGYVHTAEDGGDIHAECCDECSAYQSILDDLDVPDDDALRTSPPPPKTTAFSFVESLRTTNTSIDWSN